MLSDVFVRSVDAEFEEMSSSRVGVWFEEGGITVVVSVTVLVCFDEVSPNSSKSTPIH